MSSNSISRKAIYILLLSTLCIFAITACGGSSNVDSSTESDTKESNEESQKSNDSDLKTGEISQEVLIENLAFKAAATAIKAGTTIIWKNKDSEDHEIHANDGAWHSEPVGQGEIFELKFDATGKYGYHCHIHPEMNGTIIVE
ncbi:MAG: cupredoxin domain-containing protein [Actinomycetia bacterium]|nr:cupredoxin domain-containing protein [Actinomycetes bacterium]